MKYTTEFNHNSYFQRPQRSNTFKVRWEIFLTLIYKIFLESVSERMLKISLHLVSRVS